MEPKSPFGNPPEASVLIEKVEKKRWREDQSEYWMEKVEEMKQEGAKIIGRDARLVSFEYAVLTSQKEVVEQASAGKEWASFAETPSSQPAFQDVMDVCVMKGVPIGSSFEASEANFSGSDAWYGRRELLSGVFRGSMEWSLAIERNLSYEDFFTPNERDAVETLFPVFQAIARLDLERVTQQVADLPFMNLPERIRETLALNLSNRYQEALYLLGYDIGSETYPGRLYFQDDPLLFPAFEERDLRSFNDTSEDSYNQKSTIDLALRARRRGADDYMEYVDTVKKEIKQKGLVDMDLEKLSELGIHEQTPEIIDAAKQLFWSYLAQNRYRLKPNCPFRNSFSKWLEEGEGLQEYLKGSPNQELFLLIARIAGSWGMKDLCRDYQKRWSVLTGQKRPSRPASMMNKMKEAYMVGLLDHAVSIERQNLEAELTAQCAELLMKGDYEGMVKLRYTKLPHYEKDMSLELEVVDQVLMSLYRNGDFRRFNMVRRAANKEDFSKQIFLYEPVIAEAGQRLYDRYLEDKQGGLDVSVVQLRDRLNIMLDAFTCYTKEVPFIAGTVSRVIEQMVDEALR